MKKKAWMIGLFVIVLFSMFGCGKGSDTGSSTGQNVQSRDYVYQVTPLELEEWSGDSSYSMMKAGDVIYVYFYEYSENESGIHLASLSEDGSIAEECTIPLTENSSLNNMTCDDQGYIYAIRNNYYTDEEGNYIDDYYLVKLNIRGEELFSIYMNDLPEMQELAEDGWFYTGEVILDKDVLYVHVMGTYCQFDKEGNFQKVLAGKGENSLDNVNLYSLSDGRLVGLVYEDDGAYVGHVDMEDESLTDKSKIPGASYNYSIYPGNSKYELFLVDTYGVFGYNIGDKDKTQLMDYINSDLGVYSIYNLQSINDSEFFAGYDDMEDGKSVMGRFSKVDPKDVKEKTTVVLGCTGINWNVRSEVVKFNKNNEEYRITIQDYSSLYNTDDNYMAGFNRLNADIISGKMPDILLLDASMPVESYISKGLFEDLKPYIAEDVEFDINDFMPNIIEAYSVDGKLCRLVPYYTISTMIAKTSEVGEKRGWTIQEVNDLMDRKPEGTQLALYADRDSMLMYCMNMAGSQFVDWKTGKCSFDSDGFTEMLEFFMQFPEEIDDSIYTDDYWNSYDSMWREGRVVTMITTLSSFSDYNYWEKGTFGEPVTMIGFPSSNGDGSSIMPGMQLVMSSKSSNKEGAWQFLRYYLSDEYQEQISYGFPLSVKRLEELAEEAMKIPTYIDAEGNEIENPDYYYMNGIEIRMDPMTKEETEKLKEDLYSFTHVYNYDENLLQIIQEEAAAFFSGQKTAKDVASIIQSRAQIYVNENR